MEPVKYNAIRNDINEGRLDFRALVKKHGAENLACVLYTDVQELEEELARIESLANQYAKRLGITE